MNPNKTRYQDCSPLVQLWRCRHLIPIPFQYLYQKWMIYVGGTFNEDPIGNSMIWSTLTSEAEIKMNFYWTRDEVQKSCEDSKSDYIKRSFETFFDGVYNIEAQPGTSSTYAMGVCGLDYDTKSNTLTVYLRRPGLLIGKAGHIIDKLKEYLECEIKIEEIKKF